MSYPQKAQEAAQPVTEQVLAALELYLAGVLTLEAFTAVVGSYIAAGKAAGAAIGDAAVVAMLTDALAEPVTFNGTTVDPAEADRLTRAAGTIVADLPADQRRDGFDPAEVDKAQQRFIRLAEAEVKKAAADAVAEQIAADERITGWVRELEPEPTCQLCRWWYRDGRVWPKDHPMPRHTGCDCSQRLVVGGPEPKPVVTH